MILKFCSIPKRKQDILAHLGLKPVYMNFKRHIQPLVEQGSLEMTIPDKPRSPKQRYRTTDLGRKVLAPWSGGKTKSPSPLVPARRTRLRRNASCRQASSLAGGGEGGGEGERRERYGEN